MLTDAQMLDVRRWMGYPSLSDGELDMVRWNPNSRTSMSLTERLENLTATEETTLTDAYLTPLAALEAAILSAADNLDTKVAGPWQSNPQELTQRTGLYNQWRRDMSAFLGFAPGPALGSGRGVYLERA
jgi:hypothetical protein